MQKPAAESEPEPALPVTPCAESAKGDSTPSTFTVSQRWFAEHRKSAFLVAIAVLSPLLSLWFITKTVATVKQATWVWHLDANGVMTYAPVEIADAESLLFREILIQATEVYLKRNPAGLSNKELLPRYFSPTAASVVLAEVNKSVPERAQRNLFDQPEITKQPELLASEGGRHRYRVVGYIVRTGVIDGMAERMVGDFKIGFELGPTDSVRDRGRFPYTIRQFRKEIVWRGVVGPQGFEESETP